MVNEQEKIEVTEVEEVQATETEPKKQNAFVKFLDDWWYGFKDSFKYNPCKLAGILVALPGLFMGFFLGVHSKILFLNNNYYGLYMFLMVLLGCINVFNGVTLMGKRNLGSVITSALCSIVISVVGVLWIVAIFQSYNADVVLSKPYTLNIEHYVSMGCVVLSIVCSISGCILGFIKRDKNYKKVVF